MKKVLAVLLIGLLLSPSVFAMGFRRGPNEVKATKAAMICEADRRQNRNAALGLPPSGKIEMNRQLVLNLADNVDHPCLDYDLCPPASTSCFGL